MIAAPDERAGFDDPETGSQSELHAYIRRSFGPDEIGRRYLQLFETLAVDRSRPAGDENSVDLEPGRNSFETLLHEYRDSA